MAPIARRHRTGFVKEKPGRFVLLGEPVFEVFGRKQRQTQAFDFGPIAIRVDAYHNFQKTAGRADAMKCAKHIRFAQRYRSQQTAPRKVYVNLVGGIVKLVRKILDCGLEEKHVSRAALCRPAGRLHRKLRERLRVRIDPDVELRAILARALVYKATVAGPDIHNHAAAGKVR